MGQKESHKYVERCQVPGAQPVHFWRCRVSVTLLIQASAPLIYHPPTSSTKLTNSYSGLFLMSGHLLGSSVKILGPQVLKYCGRYNQLFGKIIMQHAAEWRALRVAYCINTSYYRTSVTKQLATCPRDLKSSLVWAVVNCLLYRGNYSFECEWYLIK
jgi:hypothetical protein